MRVALTFDDGPSEWTPAILDLLAGHCAKATFFVIGAAVLTHKPVLARIVEEGHEVGNHSFSHERITDLESDVAWDELDLTSRHITGVCGRRPVLWRAPFFDTDDRTTAIGMSLGLTHVGATVVPDDWAKTDPDEICARVVDYVEDGSVVCLHDGIPPDGGNGTASRAATVTAVALILDRLPDWEFVTVSCL